VTHHVLPGKHSTNSNEHHRIFCFNCENESLQYQCKVALGAAFNGDTNQALISELVAFARKKKLQLVFSGLTKTNRYEVKSQASNGTYIDLTDRKSGDER